MTSTARDTETSMISPIVPDKAGDAFLAAGRVGVNERDVLDGPVQ
ncbi:hypothetical protein [Halobacterium salinarum]|nr:hypothetical protein [Halobacterium salinarum]